MNRRTKALSISKKTKDIVYERDGGMCILCQGQGLPEAHYISRAKGGLGIPENIVCLCRWCHDRLDNSTERKQLLKNVKWYLDVQYPNFTDEQRKYKKGTEYA